MTFHAGVLVLGLVVVFVFGIAVGFAARGDDNRRYHAARQRYIDSVAPQIDAPVQANAHRVLPQPAPQNITNVYLTPGIPLPVDLDAIQRRPMVLEAADD